MCFVPVEFCLEPCPVGKTDYGDAFHFTPTALPILASQPSAVTYAWTRCDNLDQSEVADDLERHEDETTWRLRAGQGWRTT